MKIKLAVLAFFLLSLVVFANPAGGQVKSLDKTQIQEDPQIISKKLDPKAQILSVYLNRFDSPLQYYAQDLVDAAKAYNIDWKLVPAIAGVESTFGKQIPGGYNAWGWGVYGDQAIYFNSWRDGIFTIAKGLRENYYNKGLTDPYTINHSYAASPVWGSKVTHFMNDLDSFAAEFGPNIKSDRSEATNPQIAAISGTLTPLPYSFNPVLR